MKSFIHGCDSISCTYLKKVSDPEFWSVTYSLAVSDVYFATNMIVIRISRSRSVQPKNSGGSVIISNDISLRTHPSAEAL